MTVILSGTASEAVESSCSDELKERCRQHPQWVPSALLFAAPGWGPEQLFAGEGAGATPSIGIGDSRSGATGTRIRCRKDPSDRSARFLNAKIAKIIYRKDR